MSAQVPLTATDGHASAGRPAATIARAVSAGPLDPGARIIYVAHRRGRAEPGAAATATLEALRAHAA